MRTYVCAQQTISSCLAKKRRDRLKNWSVVQYLLYNGKNPDFVPETCNSYRLLKCPLYALYPNFSLTRKVQQSDPKRIKTNFITPEIRYSWNVRIIILSSLLQDMWSQSHENIKSIFKPLLLHLMMSVSTQVKISNSYLSSSSWMYISLCENWYHATVNKIRVYKYGV